MSNKLEACESSELVLLKYLDDQPHLSSTDAFCNGFYFSYCIEVTIDIRRLFLITISSLFNLNYIMPIAASWAISVYFAYQRTWKPFNPILGETYELTNHNGITFLAEQVSFQSVCVYV